MKALEREILRSLAIRAGLWSRPMDVGGSNRSPHSAHLKQMAARGWVRRERRNSICNLFLDSARGSYMYQITEAGRAALDTPSV